MINCLLFLHPIVKLVFVRADVSFKSVLILSRVSSYMYLSTSPQLVQSFSTPLIAVYCTCTAFPAVKNNFNCSCLFYFWISPLARCFDYSRSYRFWYCFKWENPCLFNGVYSPENPEKPEKIRKANTSQEKTWKSHVILLVMVMKKCRLHLKKSGNLAMKNCTSCFMY